METLSRFRPVAVGALATGMEKTAESEYVSVMIPKLGSSARSGAGPLIAPASRNSLAGPTEIRVRIGPPAPWVMLYRCHTLGERGMSTARTTLNAAPGRAVIPAAGAR